MDRISRLLRGLRPRQEKVLRLYFGLGCERPHSVQEMAEEFGVSVEVIAGVIGAAQRNLAQDGLTASDLRRAAAGRWAMFVGTLLTLLLIPPWRMFYSVVVLKAVGSQRTLFLGTSYVI